MSVNWTVGSTRRRMLAVAAGALLALSSTAAARAAERPQVRLTPAGQAAALAAVMSRADLHTPGGWTGGVVKPSLNPFPPCPGFSPKQADLVLNGVAETTFRHATGIGFNTIALVLKTAKMVRQDWQRTVLDPRVAGCLRHRMVQDARSTKYTFISLKPLAFPRIAPFTNAYRVIYDDRTRPQKVRIFLDLVSFSRGRTEIVMSTTGPLIGASGVLEAEIRLAQILVARAPL